MTQHFAPQVVVVEWEQARENIYEYAFSSS